tara:strand:- start:339 stop:1082 length:744 start_codon:yes stop_codon:yes gene_type:complete
VETGYLVQRRRRSKAVPRDIFGNPSTPTSSPKPAAKNPAPVPPKPAAKPPAKPAAKPPAKPAAKPPIESEPEIDVDIEAEVVDEQILRSTRKSIGLRAQSENIEGDIQENFSNRAQEIIDESKERAKTVSKPKNISTENVVEVPATPQPKPKPRRPRSSSFQPASRAKRLDRSRHMEYKYEMRSLLEDMQIPDEHRSNILGTIWARGERQTALEAKQFISEKLEQGILDEEQESTLKSVVDRYTVRR